MIGIIEIGPDGVKFVPGGDANEVKEAMLPVFRNLLAQELLHPLVDFMHLQEELTKLGQEIGLTKEEAGNAIKGFLEVVSTVVAEATSEGRTGKPSKKEQAAISTFLNTGDVKEAFKVGGLSCK